MCYLLLSTPNVLARCFYFFQFEYKAKTNQMKALRRKSNYAQQTLTFRCLNMNTYGAMMFPSDESEQYIDTSSGRYKLLTKIDKEEGCDVSLTLNVLIDSSF